MIKVRERQHCMNENMNTLCAMIAVAVIVLILLCVSMSCLDVMKFTLWGCLFICTCIYLFAEAHIFLPVTGRVIVYGQTLDAYCCVNTLLSLGISGDRIDFVQPPLGFQVSINMSISRILSACSSLILSIGYLLLGSLLYNLHWSINAPVLIACTLHHGLPVCMYWESVLTSLLALTHLCLFRS